MAAPAVTIEELPSPETNILRSKFFMRFQISGGPHMDALLYNQGTIMKLIQDIRLVQSRNIGGVGAALEIEAEVEKPVPQFAEEVKKVLDRKAQADFLAGMMKNWLAVDRGNHRVAGNRRNKLLPVWSQSFWKYCKDNLAAYWDREDDQWDMDEEDDVFYKALMESLKVIDGSKIEVEELFYFIGKKAADKPAPPGSKRKRTTGGSAAAARDSTTTTGSTAMDVDSTDSDVPLRRGNRGGRGLGGDATNEFLEDEDDDFTLNYDDLYPSEDERQDSIQATIRRRAKDKMLANVLKKAQEKGVWDNLNQIKIEDEDEATKARLASLNIG